MSDALELIARLKRSIESCDIELAVPSKLQLIEKIETGFRGALPEDLKAYLLCLDQFDEEIPILFHGCFWPFSLEEIASEYDGVTESKYFREYYITNEPDPMPGTTLDTPSPVGLRVYATQEQEFNENGYTEVHDMRRIVPLFQGESWYNLVLFQNSDGQSELAVQQQDFGLCSISPSITEHINNITVGLEKGRYTEDSFCVNMPMYWYEKVKAIADPEFREELWSS